MDQELIAYLDQRFGTLDQRLKDLRWEMNQRLRAPKVVPKWSRKSMVIGCWSGGKSRMNSLLGRLPPHPSQKGANGHRVLQKLTARVNRGF